jgi:hypothetical protein
MVLRPSIPEIENPTQDKRVSAMRAVNAALQGLTSVMKPGWKAPPAEPSAQMSTAARHEAFGLAASVSSRTALGDLRVLPLGDGDVEMAAFPSRKPVLFSTRWQSQLSPLDIPSPVPD